MKKPTNGIIGGRSAILFAVTLALLLAKVGVNKIPYFETIIVRLTQSPDGELIGRSSYLVSSWLGPAIFHFAGVDTELALFVAYSSISVGCVLIASDLLMSSGRSLPRDLIRLLGFTGLPGIFLWVGYDSLLVLLLLLGYRQRRSVSAVLLVGFLTGLQHAEIGIAASLLAIVYCSFGYRRQRPRPRDLWSLWFLLGTVVGRAALEAVFELLNSPVRSRGSIAVDVLSDNFQEWRLECSWMSLTECLPDTTFPLIFSVVWPFLPALFVLGRRSRGELIKIMTSVALAIGLAVPVLDQTRVALLALTFVSLMALDTKSGSSDSIRGPSKTSVVSFVLLWMLVPIPWVWEGEVHWYGFFDGIRSTTISGL